MSITAHRTSAVFERYNIINDADQDDAMTKLAAAADNARKVLPFRPRAAEA